MSDQTNESRLNVPLDDGEPPSDIGVANELNEALALSMAQALTVGFGQ